VSASVSGEVRAEPNLTPLLDVVFQLITFFMLVINFSKDAYDQRIRLPVAGSARPVERSKVVEDRLTLNVDRNGRLYFNGETYTTEQAVKEIAVQAELARLNAKSMGITLKDGDTLPTTLVIRADADTPFMYLFRLITACQNNGFRKYALKAMNRAS
jgi:biopolymer transport protein ExbD